MAFATGRQPAQVGRQSDAAGAGAPHVHIRAAGDPACYVYSLVEAQRVIGQAPVAVLAGGIAPADDEEIHAAVLNPLDQAFLRRQVDGVVLVDLRRRHHQGPGIDVFGGGRELQQLEHLVAKHHLALGRGDVLANLERRAVDLFRQPTVVQHIVAELAQAPGQAHATGVHQFAQRRRIG
ncbi:hypothetical protein D3C84_645570 [compost metagenome]